MKLQFIPIYEYDPTQDRDKVLGYPTDEGRITPSLVAVYKWSLDIEGTNIWHKLRGSQWRLSLAPASFCDVPRCEFLKYRKPSKEKIASLTIQEAMKYAQKDKEMQRKLTELVKTELTNKFYKG